jgi:protein SCO1/2
MKFVVASTFLCLTGCMRHTTALPVYYDVPAFDLVAQDGQSFHSAVLAGKIWVADFIYTTCPGPCPRMTSQMHEVQDAIVKMPDVKLVSFTVDPARDTPMVLADYAKVHGASSDRWYFLTGP